MRTLTFFLCLMAVGKQEEIIGGKNCKSNEAPFHVVLKHNSTEGKNPPFCGGSVIHKDWVITAAHCHKPERILSVEIGGKEVEIKEMVSYPDGRPHDILLLKLPTSTNVTTVPLPPANSCKPPALKEKVMMVGKSATTYNKNTKKKDSYITKHLQCAYTTVVGCKDHHNQNGKFYYPSLTCTNKTSVDICRGDSGGALVYDKKLYGVLVLSGQKLNKYSVASVNICYYRKWIHDVTKV